MQILELMGGKNSYLAEIPGCKSCLISGLGLVEDDLKNNSSLNEYKLHDLNLSTDLPYSNQQFDAVVCSFGIEYLLQPFEIFKDVARVLKSGGNFMIVFSDRFYKQKVISIWNDVHPFERMGIVLEYFQQSGLFKELCCESIRGKIRQHDDPFENKNIYSCPLFMIKGTRK